MGYRDALEATGITVLDYVEFGDYQGTWYAVCYLNNEYVIVSGGYGSCSGCDAFLDEFEYTEENTTPEKLKVFGQQYIDNNLITLDEAIKEAEESSKWDLESEDKLKWLQKLQNIKFSNKLQDIIE